MAPRKPRRGGVSTHRIQRSLAAMTIRTQQAYRELENQRNQVKAGETESQFKLVVTGSSGATPTDKSIRIRFPEPFFPNADRDSTFDEPVMTYGYEQRSGPAVMLTCGVTAWDKDDDGLIRGCTLRVASVRPGAFSASKFSAVLHLVFQGWAAPTLNDDEG